MNTILSTQFDSKSSLDKYRDDLLKIFVNEELTEEFYKWIMINNKFHLYNLLITNGYQPYHEHTHNVLENCFKYNLNFMKHILREDIKESQLKSRIGTEIINFVWKNEITVIKDILYSDTIKNIHELSYEDVRYAYMTDDDEDENITEDSSIQSIEIVAFASKDENMTIEDVLCPDMIEDMLEVLQQHDFSKKGNKKLSEEMKSILLQADKDGRFHN